MAQICREDCGDLLCHGIPSGNRASHERSTCRNCQRHRNVEVTIANVPVGAIKYSTYGIRSYNHTVFHDKHGVAGA